MPVPIPLLLLTDGRAPVGSYAHSFGLESAVSAGDVRDVTSLTTFVSARLHTTGLVDGSFAAAVCTRVAHLGPASDGTVLVAEANAAYAARLTAPALHATSQELGRHLMRLTLRAWPHPLVTSLRALRPEGWHHPVMLGTTCAVARLEAEDAATCALYGLAAGLSSAGVRLLGLDPIEVHAALARLADNIEGLAVTAAARANAAFETLPACSTPLSDVRAEAHAADVGGRLFAS